MTDLGYAGATFTSLEGFYTIGFDSVGATSYVIQAVPTGAQAGDAGCGVEDSCCGTFVLNHRGEKSITGGTIPADRCW